MTPLHLLALLLCALGVLLAACLVIRAAFGRPTERPYRTKKEWREVYERSRDQYERSLKEPKTTHVSASPNYVVLSGAETPPPVAKPYSEFDPLHWNKKPL